jgi:diphthamide synthase (EF-2-diphthine--ammonia ligase)
MSRNLSFLILATLLIAVVLMIVTRYALRLKASSKTEWEALLENLTAIDRDEVDRVALDAIEPSGQRRTDRLARELEPDEIWKRLGGLDGVKRLELNSRVLVEMAAYLQRSYPEAATIAEELRLQAKELELYVGRLRMADEQGSLEFHIATYAQNAAIAYYLMEQRLQALCQRANVQSFRPLQGTH